MCRHYKLRINKYERIWYNIVNINDISSYKKCQKKKYNIWVCMPQIGTCVINKLEQAQVAKQFNGKTYFTLSNLKDMKKSNSDIISYLGKNAYIVDEKKRFVLSGTQGELWTIDINKLAKTYVFGDGTIINESTLNDRINKDKAPHTMDWQLIESKGANGEFNFAMQVPFPNVFQIQTSWGSILTGNDPIIHHGKGDFIVCSVNPDGSPNLNDRWIVNGLIFGDTYDNRGWSDKVIIKDNSIVEKPKYTLIDTNFEINVAKASIQELYNLILKGDTIKKLENFTGSKVKVLPEKDSKGKIASIYLDFNYDSRDFEDGEIILKPNKREARITLHKKFNSAFLILKTWNSKGHMHDQYGNKIRLHNEIDITYNEFIKLIDDGLSKIKIPSNDTRSHKAKAKDILNIFGK